MLDIRGVCSFADYFVICSAETQRQIEAIIEDMDRALTASGATLFHREGASDSGWVLLDFGDVIVHIFAPSERDYYQLDRVWHKAIPVVRIQ